MKTQATSKAPIRILLVDDHPAILDALALAISDDPTLEVCGTALTAEEAVGLLKQRAPDVAIVDLVLGQSHGIDLIQRMVAAKGEVRIVVYSMLDEHIYAERALQVGALGYLMKTEPTTCILDAIRSAARKEVYVSRDMQMRLLNRLAHRNGDGADFFLDRLTDRELTIFSMLGQGSTVPSIADGLHLNRKTVEAHRRRIKEKLGCGTVEELLHVAIRLSPGYQAS